MTFVDTNVFMYAVGRSHPLRDPSRRFFEEAAEAGRPLVTSAEVLQQMLHAYLPTHRLETLDAAMDLARGAVVEIWSIEAEDIRLARDLLARHPGLQARDLVHLACCLRRSVAEVMTWDRALRAAFAGG